MGVMTKEQRQGLVREIVAWVGSPLLVAWIGWHGWGYVTGALAVLALAALGILRWAMKKEPR